MRTLSLAVLMSTSLFIGFAYADTAPTAPTTAPATALQQPSQVAMNQCTMGSSDCGPYAHCCSTSAGNRCYPSNTTCP